MTREQIAELAHEANRVLCLQQGDNSQPVWKDAPEWQTQSAINGVNFHLENEDSKPEDSHNSWLAEKEKDGWKYGEIKDAELKTHPCFLPYDQLPKEQQAKDFLFSSIVKGLSSFVS